MNDHPCAEAKLSTLLAEIVLMLFTELKEAKGNQVSAEDVGLLNEILADMESRTQKLEQLDAANPATAAT